jgi:hypothetical protein
MDTEERADRDRARVLPPTLIAAIVSAIDRFKMNERGRSPEIDRNRPNAGRAPALSCRNRQPG